MKICVEPSQVYLHCRHVDFGKSINGVLVKISSYVYMVWELTMRSA